MKNFFLITGIILFVANLLFGSILSFYPIFNMLVNCGVIAATTALIYALTVTKLQDGFRIPLTIIFSILGFVEFLLGLFAPQQYENNWFLIVIVLFVVFETIVFVLCNKISKIK
jgi:hypothetical protein